LRWGDEGHVARLFGDCVESLEVSRRRSELTGFADHAELRDFLKAHHPPSVAMYRAAGDDPEARAMVDDSLLGVVYLWYARGDEPSTFAQEATFVVARKRRGGS
jgi:hypothetical protein